MESLNLCFEESEFKREEKGVGIREGRENKQIIPSLIDFMTCRFYIVILVTKRFHGSEDLAFQTLDLKACVQNKGVDRRLFGSILISYMYE